MAYNNEKTVLSWINDAVRESSSSFNSMSKEEMQKLMIDLVKKKNRRENMSRYAVTEVEFYDFGPDDLVGNVLRHNGEDVCFFFTLRKPRSAGSATACRKAGDGNWKQNGACTKIQDSGKQLIGYERFFEYSEKGDKTNWRLYEYEEHNPLLDPADKMENSYVLCKLYKISSGPSNNNGERKVGTTKSSLHEEERAAKRLDTTNRQPGNQNPRSSSHFQGHSSQYSSKGNESLINFSKFPARFGIQDILHNHADNPGGTAPQSQLTQADKDNCYKLTENGPRLPDTGDWTHVSLEGFDDFQDLTDYDFP